MGKSLIIPNASFNTNKVANIVVPHTNYLVPTLRKDGFWNYLTGVYTISDAAVRVCNLYYIHVVAKKNYIVNNYLNGMYYDIVFLDANKNVISHIGGSLESWTTDVVIFETPPNSTYLCFNLYDKQTEVSSDMYVYLYGDSEDALIYEEN